MLQGTSAILDRIRFVGEGLNRPECVVAHASGLLLVPDWTPPGGVSVIMPEGKTHRILATNPAPDIDLPLRANGIALEDGGSLLIAHLGEERGAIYRLCPDGRCTTLVDRLESGPLPPANFVAADSQGRLWITVSTTKVPRAADYRPDAASGLIALFDGRGPARIVASGLGYANECLLSADERKLFVNETFARQLTAFDVVEDGLAKPRSVAVFGPGLYPDGLAAAADGSLLVTSLVSNTLLRVSPTGQPNVQVTTLLQDAVPDHVAWVEAAFQAGDMGRQHLDANPSRRLRNISNLAYGGSDLTQGYFGCLLGDAIATLPMPFAGRALPHWQYDLGPLARYL